MTPEPIQPRKYKIFAQERSLKVTLPIHIASELGICAGDRIQYFREGGNVVIRKARD